MASNDRTAYLFERFLMVYLRLIRDVDIFRERDPKHYPKRFKFKLLRRIHENIINVSDDPFRRDYGQGNTLGKEYTGPGGQKWAERELGWNRVTIRKGTRELWTGMECKDRFSLRGRKSYEKLLPNLLDDIRDIVDPKAQTDNRPIFAGTM